MAEQSTRGGLRLGGALWLLAGIACAGLLVVVFIGENAWQDNPALAALTLAGAIVGLLLGGLLIARPGPDLVRWSTGIGIVWLLAFGFVVVSALIGCASDLDACGADAGPLVSAPLITVLGVAGALVTFRAGRHEKGPT